MCVKIQKVPWYYYVLVCYDDNNLHGSTILFEHILWYMSFAMYHGNTMVFF